MVQATARVTEDAEQIENASQMVRHQAALYIGGMGARGKNFYNQLTVRYGYADAAREIQDLYLDGKKAEAAAAVPAELVAAMSLIGPRSLVAERAEAFRAAGHDTPIVLMGYYNPIYARAGGVEKFLADAGAVGIDGLIVVDLPPEEDAERVEDGRG